MILRPNPKDVHAVDDVPELNCMRPRSALYPIYLSCSFLILLALVSIALVMAKRSGWISS